MNSRSIDDAIDAWHESDSNLELHEWLGMTWEKYRRFVERMSTEEYRRLVERMSTMDQNEKMLHELRPVYSALERALSALGITIEPTDKQSDAGKLWRAKQLLIEVGSHYAPRTPAPGDTGAEDGVRAG